MNSNDILDLNFDANMNIDSNTASTRRHGEMTPTLEASIADNILDVNSDVNMNIEGNTASNRRQRDVTPSIEASISDMGAPLPPQVRQLMWL